MRLLVLALFAILCAAAWVSIRPPEKPMLVDVTVSKVGLCVSPSHWQWKQRRIA